MQRRSRICSVCNTEEQTFSKSPICLSCKAKLKSAEVIVKEKQELIDLGYDVIDGPFYDDHHHRKWKVITPCCGSTYEPLVLTIRSMLKRRGILPCASCGGKERMQIAMNAFKEKHGIDYDLEQFEDYSKKARGLSERTYQKWESVINPLGLKRGYTDYHLDHKVPVMWCFKNNVPPELVANVLNLQILPFDDNLRKHDSVQDDSWGILTGGVLNLLDYAQPKFDENKLNIWPHQLSSEALNGMLLHRVMQSKKISARQTEIRKVPFALEKEFLNNSHLAGWAKSDFAYGLYFNDELVSIVTLGKPRFNKAYDLEVIRLASKPGIIVQGGASKLFSFIKKNHSGKLLSYSDGNVGQGKVYEHCSFTYVGDTPESYFWEKNGEILSRYKTQKHKLSTLLGEAFNNSKTETELMVENGWRKVKNMPNKKWELELDLIE